MGSIVFVPAALLLLAGSAGFSLVAEGPVLQQPPAPPDPDQLDAYCTRLAQDGFSGSILVAQDGAIIFHQGYGFANDTDGTLVTSETVFDIGSLSKQFTATAVLLLEQDGLLHVEDKVSLYFPDLPPDKGGLTIHQLLTHTAGFREDHFEGDLVPMSAEEALSAIADLPLAWDPGTHYHYSNTGYTLLALIVQEVSGRPFVTYLHESLFLPAGMRHTGFYGEARWQGLPVAYTYFNGQLQGTPATWPGPYWGVMGNGGVMSTTGDMYRWVEALQTHEILSAGQTAKLFTPYVPEEPGSATYYAYGWTVTETEWGALIQHNGGGIGGNSHLAMYPDTGMTLVISSNRIVYRLPFEVRLPATDTADQLAPNIFTGDYGRMPQPTFVAYPYLVGLGLFVASLVGLVLFIWQRRVARRAP